jgi:hypothetical protein
MSVSLLAFASWFFLEKKKTSSWLVSLWLPFGLAVTSNIVLDEPLCVSYRIHHKRVLDLSVLGSLVRWTFLCWAELDATY